MRGIGGLLTLIVIIWLIVGAIAAGQRGYYSNTDPDCAGIGTLALTVVAGPLNYMGVNPAIEGCDIRQPSP
ncbi:hypothetical protein IEU95_12185 [Hoyosella rhizosphaerae]|uniref:Uncharacterized protein n=1 Tax=Hoyosella rhizosphaerae TaxID=1755582 RepID=A0A916U9Q8_9ACTN|nr:hypothetical protein [Hoyosella rhizosphaerae]MBN4927593.1 hypothetical protein [Hoyosella rhizosphaerae]GGC63241.1 hypothetical protein GCM10011410_14590 [Hoyosella rhizosphaerae]